MEKKEDIEDRKLKTGTTTVGLVCSDGVAFATDTRVTFASYIASTEMRKVFKIDNNLAMTIAGGVGDAQELIRILKAQNEIYKMSEGRQMSPKSATTLMSIILQQNKMMPFYVQLIIGGVDGDVPQLFSLDAAGGYTEEVKFAATGSGSLVILGFLEDMYKKGMNVKDGARSVAKAISLAMKRDSATGDNIRVVVITKSGYVEYFGKELEKLIAAK